jgi:hypothetical protein
MALNLIPILACVQIFSVYRFAPSPLDFGSVNNIRPPCDFNLSLHSVIWMIGLSMEVTESFPSVYIHSEMDSVPLCMWVEARNDTTYSISSRPAQPFRWHVQLWQTLTFKRLNVSALYKKSAHTVQ